MRQWGRLIWTAGLLACFASPVLAMTVADVVRLLDEGIGEDVIRQQIRKEEATFDLSVSEIVDLHDAGASDALIEEMLSDKDKDSDEDYDYDDWTEDYYPGWDSGLQARIYYDPFGYHWYGWPYYFTYYYPFRSCDFGFYYGGWWDRGWCGYGPRVNYCWNYYRHGSPGYGYDDRGDRRGRHTWDRATAERRHGGAWDRQASDGRTRSGRTREVRAPGRTRSVEPARPARSHRSWERGARGQRRTESQPPREIRSRSRGSEPRSPSVRPSERSPRSTGSHGSTGGARSSGGGRSSGRSGYRR